MKKESTWKECIESNSSIKISPDKGKAKSLHSTALGRIDFLNSITYNKTNSNYIFEGYYASALEMLHSILILNGFKVSNHICLGYFLRDVLKKEHLFRLFDDCRYKRNSLVYYGRQMDFDIAKASIKKCEQLIKELSRLVKEFN